MPWHEGCIVLGMNTSTLDYYRGLLAAVTAAGDDLEAMREVAAADFGVDSYEEGYPDTAAGIAEILEDFVLEAARSEGLSLDAVLENPASAQFVCDGASYTLAQMLVANADDAQVCAWLRHADVGDAYPDLHAADLRRVA